jgi:hypothetical protein
VNGIGVNAAAAAGAPMGVLGAAPPAVVEAIEANSTFF